MYPPIPLHFGRYASVEKTIMGKVRFRSLVLQFFNPNWHEAGHFHPPCNLVIGFCQLNLYQKFQNFFAGEY